MQLWSKWADKNLPFSPVILNIKCSHIAQKKFFHVKLNGNYPVWLTYLLNWAGPWYFALPNGNTDSKFWRSNFLGFRSFYETPESPAVGFCRELSAFMCASVTPSKWRLMKMWYLLDVLQSTVGLMKCFGTTATHKNWKTKQLFEIFCKKFPSLRGGNQKSDRSFIWWVSTAKRETQTTPGWSWKHVLLCGAGPWLSGFAGW